jgi:hypothetical protein
MGVLQDIEKFLSTQSAQRFTDIIVSEISEEDLYAGYSKSNDEPKEIVIDRLRTSCFRRYATHCEVLAGFIECGKVFVINRADKIVFILAGNKGGMAWLIPHYNPLNVDCIEQRTSVDHIFKNTGSDLWGFSKDEDKIIAELDALLNYNPNEK